MKASFVHLGLSAVFAMVVTGCTTVPTIAVRHDPPYRAEAHAATILVSASSDRGIDRIEVQLLTGDLVACTQSVLPSIFPCRQNGYWQTYTCDFGNDVRAPGSGTNSAMLVGALGRPKTATCPVRRDLTTLSLLTYRATAIDSGGRTASTNFITFSGGVAPSTVGAVFAIGPDGPVGPSGTTAIVADLESIDVVGLPAPGPTAADVLRPVWLESSAPPASTTLPRVISWDMAARIDVAFLPDADWGANYRGFSDATGTIASNMLFLPADNSIVPPFAQDYQFWRPLFSYWVGPVGAASAGADNPCIRKFSGWAVAARAVTDGQAVVHNAGFRDCATLGPGTWGTVQDSGSRFSRIFAHESGHFLHGMGDEYAEEGYEVHSSSSDPPNTFQSQQACEETAAEYSYPLSWCIPIEFSSSWRISKNPQQQVDIMDRTYAGGDTFRKDWFDTNHEAIIKRMKACLQGSCW